MFLIKLFCELCYTILNVQYRAWSRWVDLPPWANSLPSFEKFFVPWSIAAFVIAFATLYIAAFEFESPWGSIYSAFTQNLLMSILFIAMLVRRDSVAGQSMVSWEPHLDRDLERFETGDLLSGGQGDDRLLPGLPHALSATN